MFIYSLLLIILLVSSIFSPNRHSRGGSRGGGGGGAHPARAPSKIGKNLIFWRKIVIFHTKYPHNFRASLCWRNFLSAAPPPNLKTWIRPCIVIKIENILFVPIIKIQFIQLFSKRLIQFPEGLLY